MKNFMPNNSDVTYKPPNTTYPLPLTGGDRPRPPSFRQNADFNPRPHAGATLAKAVAPTDVKFQSTPPCGGDVQDSHRAAQSGISIHALMRGRPRFHKGFLLPSPYFNPHPRMGATPRTSPKPSLMIIFQSTPPYGGDIHFCGSFFRIPISIHAPMRGRRKVKGATVWPYQFQSTPPCGGDQPVRQR